jgi:pimeloyl-ACP methyl ester carboxylesterase
MTAVRRVDGAGVPLQLESWAGPDASAPPLLLLHGVSRRGSTFLPAVPAFLPRFAVHALDHRGHGGSARAASYLVRDYAADAVCVAGAFGRPVVLYGHSLGALVALLAAAELPGRIAAVVVEDPPGQSFLARVGEGDYRPIFDLYRRHAGSPLTTTELARLLDAAILESPTGGPPRRFGAIRDAAGVRLTAACLKALDPAVLDPLLAGAWLEGVDWPAALGAVACPVLLLRGEPALGGMLPAADLQTLRDGVADLTVIDFAARSPWGTAGHNILGQSPDVLPRFVVPFLLATVAGGEGGA